MQGGVGEADVQGLFLFPPIRLHRHAVLIGGCAAFRFLIEGLKYAVKMAEGLVYVTYITYGRAENYAKGDKNAYNRTYHILLLCLP